MARPLVVGNWKMHGCKADVGQALAVADALAVAPAAARVALCPPMTLIPALADALAGSMVEVGGQDCHSEPFGAFTGEVSAEMLADAGARVVLIGHSERRTMFGETDASVAAKFAAARRAGLEPIICVGETLDERKAGLAIEVVHRQIEGVLPDGAPDARFAVAYEPVWAIGSGITPSIGEIEEMHAVVGSCLDGRREVPVLYGGSVKPANAKTILGARGVGGALVGGASLKADDFLAIVRAAR